MAITDDEMDDLIEITNISFFSGQKNDCSCANVKLHERSRSSSVVDKEHDSQSRNREDNKIIPEQGVQENKNPSGRKSSYDSDGNEKPGEYLKVRNEAEVLFHKDAKPKSIDAEIKTNDKYGVDYEDSSCCRQVIYNFVCKTHDSNKICYEKEKSPLASNLQKNSLKFFPNINKSHSKVTSCARPRMPYNNQQKNFQQVQQTQLHQFLQQKQLQENIAQLRFPNPHMTQQVYQKQRFQMQHLKMKQQQQSFCWFQQQQRFLSKNQQRKNSLQNPSFYNPELTPMQMYNSHFEEYGRNAIPRRGSGVNLSTSVIHEGQVESAEPSSSFAFDGGPPPTSHVWQPINACVKQSVPAESTCVYSTSPKIVASNNKYHLPEDLLFSNQPDNCHNTQTVPRRSLQDDFRINPGQQETTHLWPASGTVPGVTVTEYPNPDCQKISEFGFSEKDNPEKPCWPMPMNSKMDYSNDSSITPDNSYTNSSMWNSGIPLGCLLDSLSKTSSNSQENKLNAEVPLPHEPSSDGIQNKTNVEQDIWKVRYGTMCVYL